MISRRNPSASSRRRRLDGLVACGRSGTRRVRGAPRRRGCRTAAPRRAGRRPAAPPPRRPRRRAWARRSSSRRPASRRSALPNTASIRPRTTRSPSTAISKGTSTSVGVRAAHSLARNAARSCSKSPSSAAVVVGGAGQLVEVEQGLRAPALLEPACGTRVPRRAQRRGPARQRAGGCCGPARPGRARARPAATPTAGAGSSTSTVVAAREPGPLGQQPVDVAAPLAARPRSPDATIGSCVDAARARTSAAPASTAARRPGPRSPGNGPSGSSGQLRGAGVGGQRVGLVRLGLGPLDSVAERRGSSSRNGDGSRGFCVGVPDVAGREQRRCAPG